MVNDPNVVKHLDIYAQDRIGILRNALETETRMEEVRVLQGRIAELRRFSTLRDEVTVHAR